MNYELKSSIHKKGLNSPIKILLLIIFFLLIFHIFIPSFFPSLFITIVNPLWNINNKANNISVDLISNESRDIIVSQLREENFQLKEVLDRKISDNIILGYILKKPPFTAYDSFIIDIGSDHNILKGDKVYVSGNIQIGEIAEIFAHISKVKLYSSYGEKFDVLIGDKNIEAIATGRGGGSFEVIVPRDIGIKEGDIVTIPDISSLVFGIVQKIVLDPVKAFSTVIFSQPINIYEQKWVQIYER